MAGIFEYLQDIFVALFIRNPQEVERRRRLKSYYAELKKQKPLYYRRLPDQLLPDFARIVLKLAIQLRPLRELFDKTICNSDPKLAQRYKDYLVVARLPKNLQAVHSSFAYKALKDRVLQADDPNEELERTDKEIEELLAGLSRSEFQGFDSSYTSLDRLVALSSHNFIPLLRLFDPSLHSLDGADPAAFDSISGENALQELLDFYFILAELRLTEGVEKNMRFLLDRLARDRSQNAKERMKKVLDRLKKLLSEQMRSESILALIRLIQKEPHFVPQTIQEESSFLEAFKNRLRIGYQKNKTRIQGALRAQVVEDDLKRLFPSLELEQIEGYREDIDQALQQREYDGFVHIRALCILKNYIQVHFNRELKNGLKRLIVEGKFENKIFQNMFTNTYHQCDGMLGKIKQFEEELQGEGTQSAKKLPKYIELLDQGKPVHNMVNTVLEAIDKNSRLLVEEGANCFYNLCVILLEILNDAKQKTPAQISNIKLMAGKKTQEYLARLTYGYNNLYLFAKIMKNFTTIKQLAMSLDEQRT